MTRRELLRALATATAAGAALQAFAEALPAVAFEPKFFYVSITVPAGGVLTYEMLKSVREVRHDVVAQLRAEEAS